MPKVASKHPERPARPFFTVGHSNHSLDAFLELVQVAGVELVVDIRTVPRSRQNPQFNRETLPANLSRAKIGYEYIEELGGLRGRIRNVAPDVNGFWRNRSFHNYADYALGDEFKAGLSILREKGHALACAIMCAESVWWRCHRRIVADYLIAAGETVFHIMGRSRVEPAELTSAARVDPSGIVTYPVESRSCE